MLKLLNVIGEYSREALAIDVERSIYADGVLACLERLAAEHGASAYVRFDHRRPDCLDGSMTGEEPRVVRASRIIEASAERVFELIADPAQQPRWDGNDNLEEAAPGQRVRAVGDVFTMRLKRGGVRDNLVADFAEGRRLAWRPAVQGESPPGHLWAWELEPLGPSRTLVTHIYDWTELTDPSRMPRARATTAEKLQASLERLAALAEQPGP